MTKESPWPSVIGDVTRSVMRKRHGQILTRPLLLRLAQEIADELNEQLTFDYLATAGDYLGGRGVPYLAHEALRRFEGQALHEGIAIDRAAALADVLVGLFDVQWSEKTEPMANPWPFRAAVSR